jgi:Ca2+-binding EF-hand superfamily protein
LARAALPLAVVLLALAACGHSREPSTDPSAHLLYSPNGEPLNGGPLGRPKCSDAMSRWFDRTDRDHDGMIERGEFIADARRQFAAMDLDRSGVLTPAKLAQYRLPYAGPPVSEEKIEEKRPRENAIITGGPDPVMAADLSLRNEVTLKDFLAHAERRFAALDADHDGRLSRAEVQAPCNTAER